MYFAPRWTCHGSVGGRNVIAQTKRKAKLASVHRHRHSEWKESPLVCVCVCLHKINEKAKQLHWFRNTITLKCYKRHRIPLNWGNILWHMPFVDCVVATFSLVCVYAFVMVLLLLFVVYSFKIQRYHSSLVCACVRACVTVGFNTQIPDN